MPKHKGKKIEIAWQKRISTPFGKEGPPESVLIEFPTDSRKDNEFRVRTCQRSSFSTL